MMNNERSAIPIVSERTHAEAPDAAAAFVAEFRARYGRAPRLLHVGNIANNAYLNAKFLNRAGFDCDVICYDYYHLMGCPEWEDADFDGQVVDQFRPDWSSLDLRGFERPRWFVQGAPYLCIDYLIAKRTGDEKQARRLWKALEHGQPHPAQVRSDRSGGVPQGAKPDGARHLDDSRLAERAGPALVEAGILGV